MSQCFFGANYWTQTVLQKYLSALLHLNCVIDTMTRNLSRPLVWFLPAKLRQSSRRELIGNIARKEWPDISHVFFCRKRSCTNEFSGGWKFPANEKGTVQSFSLFFFPAFDNFNTGTLTKFSGPNSYRSESTMHNFVWTNHYCGHSLTVRWQQIRLRGSCPAR